MSNLDLKIMYLEGLGGREVNALRAEGINTVRELLAYDSIKARNLDRYDLIKALKKRVPNLGEAACANIARSLNGLDLEDARIEAGASQLDRIEAKLDQLLNQRQMTNADAITAAINFNRTG
jgi:hypothetical protein